MCDLCCWLEAHASLMMSCVLGRIRGYHKSLKQIVNNWTFITWEHINKLHFACYVHLKTKNQFQLGLFISSWGWFWSHKKKQIPWTSWRSSTMKFPSSWDIFPPQKKTNTGSHSLSCESTWQLSLSLSESERPLNYCSTKIIKSWAAYCISSQDAIQVTKKKNILLTINYTRCFMRDPYKWLMIIPNITG